MQQVEQLWSRNWSRNGPCGNAAERRGGFLAARWQKNLYTPPARPYVPFAQVSRRLLLV
jgi:hypothetical protein